MNIEAIWLRRIGDRVQVLYEGEKIGEWRLVIDEGADGDFSHIAEHRALEAAPVDSLTDNPYRKDGRIWVTAKRTDC